MLWSRKKRRASGELGSLLLGAFLGFAFSRVQSKRNKVLEGGGELLPLPSPAESIEIENSVEQIRVLQEESKESIPLPVLRECEFEREGVGCVVKSVFFWIFIAFLLFLAVLTLVISLSGSMENVGIYLISYSLVTLFLYLVLLVIIRGSRLMVSAALIMLGIVGLEMFLRVLSQATDWYSEYLRNIGLG